MDVREKLAELIRCADYHPCRGAVRKIGSMFTTEFIEDIASQLIDNGVTVQEWISVDDRLPRNYTPVLAYIPSLAQTMQQTVHECHIGEDGEWHSSTAPAYQEGVAHWMPLPEPPKGE